MPEAAFLLPPNPVTAKKAQSFNKSFLTDVSVTNPDRGFLGAVPTHNLSIGNDPAAKRCEVNPGSLITTSAKQRAHHTQEKHSEQEHFPQSSCLCPHSSTGCFLYTEGAKDYLWCLCLHRLLLHLGLHCPHCSLAKRCHTAGLPTQRHSNGRGGLQA